MSAAPQSRTCLEADVGHLMCKVGQYGMAEDALGNYEDDDTGNQKDLVEAALQVVPSWTYDGTLGEDELA